MTARVGAGAIAIGAALALAHAALLPALEGATARPALRVTWDGGLVADAPSTGIVAPGVDAIVTRDGAAPGLVITRYTTHYRGGVARSVAAAQLVGPFQDPAAPPCTGRLAVGQRLLDDGAGGPGTIAAIVRRELTAALTGTEAFAIGRFVRVDAVRLRWVRMFDVPFESGMFAATALRTPAPSGYLRGEATVVFDRITAVIVLGLLPRTDGGTVGFTVGVRAHLDLDNGALRWLSDRIGGDRIATRFAEGQLDTALLSALGPPPPLELPGGRRLIVEPCPDRGVEVVTDHHASLPLRWRLTAPPPGAPAIRPPHRGPVAWPPPRDDATLTFDLDLDGLNGLLYELWRTGYLDDQLDRLDLAGRFNRDPTVATYLSLRLSPLRLALPPIAAPAPASADALRLGLVLAVNVADRDAVVAATALGALDIGFAPGDTIRTDVAVTGLELTCHPRPDQLVPCYGDLVAGVRAATADTHAALGAALSTVLTDLFVGRELAADAAPATLVIDRARAKTIAAAQAVRLELDARIAPPR